MIGILALQGAFAEHSKMFNSIGQETFEIRKRSDLERKMDGIVVPGGESTVMCKLMNDLGMMNIVRENILNGLPAFGTCAGAIMLADRVVNGGTGIGTMPITILRNAYGRQLGSFSTTSEFNGTHIPMRFIRAPVITEVRKGTEILAELDGKIVAARYGKQIATTFHPELTDNTYIHEMFVKMCV
jgi:pyridoxal 5''-phosphate synthase, glutaminase subunit Pdx2